VSDGNPAASLQVFFTLLAEWFRYGISLRPGSRPQ
jgi:hypothetical protein